MRREFGSKGQPEKDRMCFASIDHVEKISGERVRHAQEMESDLEGARTKLEARFGGVEM